MDISGVNNSTNTYAVTSAQADTAGKAEEAAENKADDDKAAVVYEKSTETKKSSTSTIYNRDSIKAQLKADQESRMASMQSLVEKLLSKQNNKYQTSNLFGDNASNLKAIFSDAAKNADAKTIAQAQADVADDGYWGVEQTSDRLVEMAIALSGGDTTKADTMIEAIKKGFDQATKAWGDKLPDICQKTVDAAIEKLNAWKDGLTQ